MTNFSINIFLECVPGPVPADDPGKESYKDMGLMIRRIFIVLEIAVYFLLTALMVPYAISCILSGRDIAISVMVAAAFLMDLIISAGALIRTRKEHRLYILPEIGMKLWTAVLAIGIYGFFDDGVQMGIAFTSLCMIVLLLFGLLAKRPDLFQDKKVYPGNPYDAGFTADKAKYYWDDAAKEYAALCGRDISEFTEEDNDRVFEYASLHMAYFMQWIIDRGFSSDLLKEYLQEYPGAAGFDVVLAFDLGISMDEIDPMLQPFMDTYYLSQYFGDYYLSSPEDAAYCRTYSGDTYRAVSERIDRAYRYFMISQPSDDMWDEETLRESLLIPGLGESFGIYASKECPEDYYRRCRDYLLEKGEMLAGEIYNEAARWLRSFGEEKEMERYPDSKSFFSQGCSSGTVYIGRPFGEDIAFIIGFESDIEPEHGIGLGVRDGIVLELGYRMDALSPWCRDMERLYESLMQIRSGKTAEREGVKLPEVIIRRIDETERLIRMRERFGAVKSHDMSYRYEDESDIPRYVIFREFSSSGNMVSYVQLQAW